MPNLSRTTTVWKDNPFTPRPRKFRPMGEGWRLATEPRPDGCQLTGIRTVFIGGTTFKLYRWKKAVSTTNKTEGKQNGQD